jgi:hypothetical protein
MNRPDTPGVFEGGSETLPYLTSFGAVVVGIDVEYGFGCFA